MVNELGTSSASTAATAGPPLGGRLRRGCWGCILGGDQEDLVGLGVQRAGLRAGHRFHVLLDLKAGRAVFL